MNQARFFQLNCLLKNSLINMLMFTSLSCELLKVDRNEINMIVNVSKSPVWSERCHFNISHCPTEGVGFHTDDFVRLNTLEVVI